METSVVVNNGLCPMRIRMSRLELDELDSQKTPASADRRYDRQVAWQRPRGNLRATRRGGITATGPKKKPEGHG